MTDDEKADVSELHHAQELDTEAQTLLSQPAHPPNYRLWLSIPVNAVATILIVFINKRLFETGGLRNAQVSFAAFHFVITAALLFILSRPFINVFQAKRVDILAILPLSLAMILNVVLQNVALAHCSIQFNQVARVLLTPCCVLLNYLLYGASIPLRAAATLVPVCVGVAVVSYFDTVAASSSAKLRDTTPVGVAFAFCAVWASAVYTVWIKPFHKRLNCDSWQLLLNQSAVSVGAMLYIIPFSDDRSFWHTLDIPTWGLVLLSGAMAACINLSQFVIIHDAGPVSSTVVGHFKTCSIILLGWVTSQHSSTDASILGFIMAIGGILSYSYIMLKQPS